MDPTWSPLGCLTSADGAPLDESTVEERKVAAERKVALAEEAVERGEEGAQSLLEQAEEELDQILEELLQDEADLMEEAGEDDDEDEEDEEDEEENSENADDRKEAAGSEEDQHDDEEDVQPSAESAAALGLTATTKTSADPEHFSLADPRKPISELEARFPGFSKAVCTQVELEAGDLLYLPAGWFHEVTSFSSDPPDLEHLGHMALNFWFHPPDQNSFAEPYKNNYWKRYWKETVEPELVARRRSLGQKRTSQTTDKEVQKRAKK